MKNIQEKKVSSKKRKIWIIVLIVIAVIIIISFFAVKIFVGTGKNINEAKKTVDIFYSSVKNNDFDGASKLYSYNLLNVTSKDDMDKLLNFSQTKLGDIKNYSVLSFNIFYTTSGTSISLIYEVNRTKYNSQDLFSLSRKNSNEPFQIDGYHISSNYLPQN
jgi:uncharacterized membrane protein YvbJ